MGVGNRTSYDFQVHGLQRQHLANRERLKKTTAIEQFTSMKTQDGSMYSKMH